MSAHFIENISNYIYLNLLEHVIKSMFTHFYVPATSGLYYGIYSQVSTGQISPSNKKSIGVKRVENAFSKIFCTVKRKKMVTGVRCIGNRCYITFNKVNFIPQSTRDYSSALSEG